MQILQIKNKLIVLSAALLFIAAIINLSSGWSLLEEVVFSVSSGYPGFTFFVALAIVFFIFTPFIFLILENKRAYWFTLLLVTIPYSGLYFLELAFTGLDPYRSNDIEALIVKVLILSVPILLIASTIIARLVVSSAINEKSSISITNFLRAVGHTVLIFFFLFLLWSLYPLLMSITEPFIGPNISIAGFSIFIICLLIIYYFYKKNKTNR